MATASFYKGRPVKRMYRTPAGLKLNMVSPVAGVRGDQLIVSQEDWALHGERREVGKSTTSALRIMVNAERD